MNINYLGVLTFFIYLSVAFAQGLHLLGRLTPPKWHYYTASLLSLSAHGWILYQLIEMPLGQNLNGMIMFSFTLWVMNILILLAGLRVPLKNLCVATYPLAALSLYPALSLSSPEVINTKAQPTILTHIFISMLAVSLLSLASLQALLMGFQNYLLKHHRPAPLLRILPPLQTMEDLLFSIIGIGLVFLSGSLLSGLFFEKALFHPLLSPKVSLAVAAWLLLSVLLVGRYLFGWRGPTAIRWTLIGVLLVLLSYFGTKLIFPFLTSFTWTSAGGLLCLP